MDKELIILEQIQNNPQVKQRDLATIAKASLGMTNAILKRFVDKGLITISKVNNRNIRYVLTIKGLDEINRRSWNYFKRTIKNVVDYQDAIKEIMNVAKQNGYEGISLVGNSDLEFIVEHICYKVDMPFQAIKNIDEKKDCWFVFQAENESFISDTSEDNPNVFSLNRLFIH